MNNKGRTPNKFDEIEHEIVKKMMASLKVDDEHEYANIIKICAHAARMAVEKYDQKK